MLGLSSTTNKIGCLTYLSNDKESLIVAYADIEGGRGLTLYISYILGGLHHVIKAANFWCGDNDIINNVTPQLFQPSYKLFQLKRELE